MLSIFFNRKIFHPFPINTKLQLDINQLAHTRDPRLFSRKRFKSNTMSQEPHFLIT